MSYCRFCRTAGALGIATVLAAQASVAQVRPPSISCAVNDSNLHLDLFLPMTFEGPVDKGGLQGSLDIHHYKVTKERRSWKLDGRMPTQLWYVGNDLKLRLTLVPGENLIDLIIDTQRRPDAAVHTGNFKLETGEGVRVTGRIECRAG
jgi:hypothetical protein